LSGFWAMIGKSNAVLLALLLALPTAFMATAFIAPAVGQPNYSAWLKIVTELMGWNRVVHLRLSFQTRLHHIKAGLPDQVQRRRMSVLSCTGSRVLAIDQDFNNPNWPRNLLGNLSWEGPAPPVTDRPNGTGFIQVRWPSGWDNVTIVVKARSYQGECIGAGNPFTGIIVYWLTVNATERFKHALIGAPWASIPYGRNVTLNDDGIFDTHPTGAGVNFDFNLPVPAISLGRLTSRQSCYWCRPPADFAGNFSTPGRAWVARAAYMFKVFHEHTWYGVNDVLTYATIFIYDTDHTPAGSDAHFVDTGGDNRRLTARADTPVKSTQPTREGVSSTQAEVMPTTGLSPYPSRYLTSTTAHPSTEE
jgi:hypothetical protein